MRWQRLLSRLGGDSGAGTEGCQGEGGQPRQRVSGRHPEEALARRWRRTPGAPASFFQPFLRDGFCPFPPLNWRDILSALTVRVHTARHYQDLRSARTHRLRSERLRSTDTAESFLAVRVVSL